MLKPALDRDTMDLATRQAHRETSFCFPYDTGDQFVGIAMGVGVRPSFVSAVEQESYTVRSSLAVACRTRRLADGLVTLLLRRQTRAVVMTCAMPGHRVMVGDQVTERSTGFDRARVECLFRVWAEVLLVWSQRRCPKNTAATNVRLLPCGTLVDLNRAMN
jgi:hypothetical protein